MKEQFLPILIPLLITQTLPTLSLKEMKLRTAPTRGKLLLGSLMGPIHTSLLLCCRFPCPEPRLVSSPLLILRLRLFLLFLTPGLFARTIDGSLFQG